MLYTNIYIYIINYFPPSIIIKKKVFNIKKLFFDNFFFLLSFLFLVLQVNNLKSKREIKEMYRFTMLIAYMQLISECSLNKTIEI